MNKQRAHRRIKVNLPVTYAFSGEYKYNAQKGITRDISCSGMCFYSDKLLREGLTLNVQIPKIWNVPRICIVRWSSMKSTNCYKVGVSFH